MAPPGKHPIFVGLTLLGAASLLALAASADDRATIQETLRALEAVPADAELGKDAIERAKSALVRAEGARSSGDQLHGAMLEALALEWAMSAKDLARTARIEKELVQLQRKAVDAETKAVRAQALVEQTVARRGRAEEKLRELEAGATKQAASESAAPSKPPPSPTPAPKGKQ